MKRKEQHSGEETTEKRRFTVEAEEVAVSNSRLLSFDDEEEDSG